MGNAFSGHGVNPRDRSVLDLLDYSSDSTDKDPDEPIQNYVTYAATCTLPPPVPPPPANLPRDTGIPSERDANGLPIYSTPINNIARCERVLTWLVVSDEGGSVTEYALSLTRQALEQLTAEETQPVPGHIDAKTKSAWQDGLRQMAEAALSNASHMLKLA